jgi:hypothetical protein
MNLPPSLARWSKYLNIFPEEISLALGPIIQRISMAVGSPRSQFKEKEGEPDGFDGLNRRGGYERLLLSEWMLADEMQEEFMRRAVMGEHLFLNPARCSPVGTRASLALFDAGPSQLGSPRIAHLAALIVLANRADTAGASFGWGVLQQSEMPLFREVTSSNIMRLLEARSHRETTNTEVRAWESRVDTWSGMDDVWLIGGERLSRLEAGKGTSRLYVKDPLDAGARQLSLSVCSASNSSRELVLDLPADKISTRLLRDPFDVAVADIQKVERSLSPGSNLLFDSSGRKLFARGERWGVTAFNVPNSPLAGSGKPRKYRTHRWQTVSAVGGVGRRAIALISGQDHFVRLEFCRQGTAKLPAGNYAGYNQKNFYTSAADDGAPLMPCFSLPWDGEVAALDAVGSLFRLVKLKGDEKSVGGTPVVGTAHLIATEVLGIAPVSSRLVYVGKEWPADNLYIVSLGTDVARMAIPFEGKASKAFFGPPSTLAHEKFGLLAIEQSDLQWTVITAKGETILVRPNEASVVGVLANDIKGGEPGLVALEGDQRTLTLNGRNWRHKILQSTAPIDCVVVSHAARHIAYSTVTGEIVVYSLQHRTDLCRYVTERPA